MNKQKLITLVIAILLIIAIAYIGVDKYTQAVQQEQLSIFQQGAQYGFEQAIIQIVQQASTCQQVPLIVGNTTINMIAVECLQQE